MVRRPARRRAVADAKSRDEVYTALGLHAPTKETRVRVVGNAMRLGLDLHHLDHAGCTVSFPQEGSIYDLIVDPATGAILRVQVKSTIRTLNELGSVSVSRRPYSVKNLAPRLPYDPKVIDYFFIVDGSYNLYLIPIQIIARKLGITLRTYREYIVGNASGLAGITGSASTRASA